MHLTRSELTKKIPVPRKGTKYIARAFSDLDNAVPVVVAVRDMLKIARTSKEVKEMIKQKLLKINGREVIDVHESVKVFSILSAKKDYILTYNKTGKFTLEEYSKQERPCKVINKTLVKKGKTQINLHDGCNFISDKKINPSDTIYLDLSGKVKKHISFEKGKKCFIINGKYVGSEGVIESIEGQKTKIKINEIEETVTVNKKGVIVI